MAKACPWCGKTLEIKTREHGSNIQEVCGRCGYKIREYKKPTPVQKAEIPSIVEIKDDERPRVREKSVWPLIATIVAIVVIVVVLVKVFLVK